MEKEKNEKKNNHFLNITVPQQKRINILVDEYLKTFIIPNCGFKISNEEYKGLFEGLRDYSAWLLLHD